MYNLIVYLDVLLFQNPNANNANENNINADEFAFFVHSSYFSFYILYIHNSRIKKKKK